MCDRTHVRSRQLLDILDNDTKRCLLASMPSDVLLASYAVLSKQTKSEAAEHIMEDDFFLTSWAGHERPSTSLRTMHHPHSILRSVLSQKATVRLGSFSLNLEQLRSAAATSATLVICPHMLVPTPSSLLAVGPKALKPLLTIVAHVAMSPGSVVTKVRLQTQNDVASETDESSGEEDDQAANGRLVDVRLPAVARGEEVHYPDLYRCSSWCINSVSEPSERLNVWSARLITELLAAVVARKGEAPFLTALEFDGIARADGISRRFEGALSRAEFALTSMLCAMRPCGAPHVTSLSIGECAFAGASSLAALCTLIETGGLPSLRTIRCDTDDPAPILRALGSPRAPAVRTQEGALSCFTALLQETPQLHSLNLLHCCNEGFSYPPRADNSFDAAELEKLVRVAASRGVSLCGPFDLGTEAWGGPSDGLPHGVRGLACNVWQKQDASADTCVEKLNTTLVEAALRLIPGVDDTANYAQQVAKAIMMASPDDD